MPLLIKIKLEKGGGGGGGGRGRGEGGSQKGVSVYFERCIIIIDHQDSDTLSFVHDYLRNPDNNLCLSPDEQSKCKCALSYAHSASQLMNILFLRL